MHVNRELAYLSQAFRVYHVGCSSILLVFRQEDLHVLTACCPGECHIELPVRKDRNLKVDSYVLNRLDLGIVDGDRGREANGELATLHLEGKVGFVFCWRERYSRDEFGPAATTAGRCER
jgi:hypothetical protein